MKIELSSYDPKKFWSAITASISSMESVGSSEVNPVTIRPIIQVVEDYLDNKKTIEESLDNYITGTDLDDGNLFIRGYKKHGRSSVTITHKNYIVFLFKMEVYDGKSFNYKASLKTIPFSLDDLEVLK